MKRFRHFVGTLLAAVMLVSIVPAAYATGTDAIRSPLAPAIPELPTIPIGLPALAARIGGPLKRSSLRELRLPVIMTTTLMFPAHFGPITPL